MQILSNPFFLLVAGMALVTEALITPGTQPMSAGIGGWIMGINGSVIWNMWRKDSNDQAKT